MTKLNAVVAVVDQPVGLQRPPVVECLLQRIQHEAGMQGAGGPPAADPAGEGVEVLTRAPALELGSALRVSAVVPGLVRTEAHDHLPSDVGSKMYAGVAKAYPAGRIGEPNDIAEASLVALTNGFTTGATIDVDDGYLAS